ncbi:MAG: hypothetical protein PWR00_1242 [Thermovirga sp.]|jgi:peptide/nickel transport system ATP-binding protein|nr:hypothetical protein [Thermovirga sp.]
MSNVPVVEGLCLSKSFKRKNNTYVTLFSNLSFSIYKGEIVGLCGESGKGKTTLGNLLLNIIHPDEGSILWNGKDISMLSRKERKRLRPLFQKIYQDPALSFPPHQRIQDMFKDFYRWGKHTSFSSERAWWDSLREGMVKASLSEKLLDRYPCQLSGGELQRFAILRAMLFSPLFLVADEPTSRLDPSIQARIAHMIVKNAKEKNTAILFISHNRALLEAVCSRIIYLE